MASKHFDRTAAFKAQKKSGRPAIAFIFLSGMDFDPPLNGISATHFIDQNACRESASICFAALLLSLVKDYL